MARIELAPELFDDFDRFREHLAAFEVPRAEVEARLRGIVRAIDLLAQSPMLGRPAGEGRRELVIGRGSRGYVVLFRYVRALDLVLVLAARHQREGGYAR